MEQNSSEADSYSPSMELKIHYRVHNSTPPALIMSHTDPFHTLTPLS